MTTHDNTDNGGPKVDPEFEAIQQRVNDLYDEARNFADGEPIASEDMAEAITALFDGLHVAGNEAEALRKAAVKPLDEAKTAIQALYHPLIGDTKSGKGKVIRGKEALQALLTPWRTQVAAEKAAAAQKARDEAEALRKEAEEAIRSSAGNLEARESAEEVLEYAKEADRFARRTEKAATTGLGLRTKWVAVMTDEGEALDWAYTRAPARFAELVQQMADEHVRAGSREVPGFRVEQERKAA